MSRQAGDKDSMAELQRAAQVIEGRKKTRVGLRMLLLLLALGGAVWAYYEFGVVIPEERVQVSLLRVSDGDTLLVLDPDDREMKVRLIGVNAPELGTAASFKSALYTAELLEKARMIYVEPEPDSPRDKYGRCLGWVFVLRPDGKEVLLQEELVRNGHAELYRHAKGSTYFERVAKAQKKKR